MSEGGFNPEANLPAREVAQSMIPQSEVLVPQSVALESKAPENKEQPSESKESEK